ncbi:MAG: hypothetical protein SFX73_32660 [Kofleriaceae bacterium]|nr:hypothetical protein [Kofleriaceae bacterium]
MRSWWFAIALCLAACGGSKKSASTPSAGSDAGEAERRGDDADDRDQARPDNEDDMPSREMADPCNE